MSDVRLRKLVAQQNASSPPSGKALDWAGWALDSKRGALHWNATKASP